MQWRRKPEPRKARNKIGKSFLKQNICPKSKYRPKEEKKSQDILTQTANRTTEPQTPPPVKPQTVSHTANCQPQPKPQATPRTEQSNRKLNNRTANCQPHREPNNR
ncbi:MAG: hypothetical protein J6X67_01810, partial [Treponema sp.]|nr:hypothetical protein [Treponema sp.]